MSDHSLFIIQVNGPDKPGIFVNLCLFLTKNKSNILEVSQNVLRGFLSITFLVDNKNSVLARDLFKLNLNKLARENGITTFLTKYEEGYRPRIRHLYILTVIGKDRMGILAKLGGLLTKYNVNIESINTKVSFGGIYNQFLLDIQENINVVELRNALRKGCEEFGLSLVLQSEKLYKKNKRLIAFDMDSTLVVGETIVEIAKRINKGQEMQEVTELTMSSRLDFKKSISERVKLIKGVSQSTLQEVADGLVITPGVEELIMQLKSMGWKIALISSGFSIFTDAVKQRLGLDYSFGNTLEIQEGVVTGEIVGEIIDGERKWEIIMELAEQLEIRAEEVVTVGDGSNDMIMLRNSGLGLGLNSKEIASEVADGRVNQADVTNILLMLGLSDTEVERIFYKNNDVEKEINHLK